MKRNIIILLGLVWLIPGLATAQYWSANGSKIYYNSNNVGISTSNPTSRLHVKGNYTLGSTYAILAEGNSGQHATLAIKGAYQTGSSSMTSNLQFTNGNNTKYWTVSSRNNWKNPSNQYEGYDLRFSFYNGSSWSNTLTFRENGNIGIGTKTPGQRLEVASGNNQALIKLRNSYFNTRGDGGWKVGVDGSVFYIKDHNNNGIFQIKEDLTITMGISNRKTIVLGKLCVKPNASTSCPDYVFEEDYRLRSLSELEDYLEKNKHLPGVKSASEIEKEGSVDFIEMSYSLLEKVEELTLYTIEQDKRLNAQQEEIKALKAALSQTQE